MSADREGLRSDGGARTVADAKNAFDSIVAEKIKDALAGRRARSPRASSDSQSAASSRPRWIYIMSKRSRPRPESEAAQGDSAADLTLDGRDPTPPDRAWRVEDLERLHRLGLHVIPIRASKLPAIRWRGGTRDYVHCRPTPAEIQSWMKREPEGWAVVCGGPARVVVLDIEQSGWSDGGWQGDGIRQVVQSLPPSCLRRSPSGGIHALLRVTDGPVPCARGTKLVQKRVGDGKVVLLAELRTEGHYVVALGPGRGDLAADFAPQEVTAAELEAIAELRSMSDVPPGEHVEAAPPHRTGQVVSVRDEGVDMGWLEELSASAPCRVVQAAAETALKQLATDALTPAILGPVLQLVRLAFLGHQGVSQALADIGAEFLGRVELRGDRTGGAAAAKDQWQRSVAGALTLVDRPAWMDGPDRRVCACFLTEVREAHRAARLPLTSQGRARTTEAMVLEYLLSWARTARSPVVRQSQRQIAQATDVGLAPVNRAIARLIQQGWLIRHRRDWTQIDGLELVMPAAISATTTEPLAEGVSVVALMALAVHPIFGSRGLGQGVAETFAMLPEFRRPLATRSGYLVRVSPGSAQDVPGRPPSSRPVPPPPSGSATVAQLADRTGKAPTTVRRHLRRLSQVGLTFRDDAGRWWRYRAHPDWVAERYGIEDGSIAKGRLFDQHRRNWFVPQVMAGDVHRDEHSDSDVYVEASTGEVRWVDWDPPRLRRSRSSSGPSPSTVPGSDPTELSPEDEEAQSAWR